MSTQKVRYSAGERRVRSPASPLSTRYRARHRWHKCPNRDRILRPRSSFCSLTASGPLRLTRLRGRRANRSPMMGSPVHRGGGSRGFQPRAGPRDALLEFRPACRPGVSLQSANQPRRAGMVLGSIGVRGPAERGPRTRRILARCQIVDNSRGQAGSPRSPKAYLQPITAIYRCPGRL